MRHPALIRDERLHVKPTAEERANLEAQARVEGVTVSELVRRWVRGSTRADAVGPKIQAT
jgi:hypothetical protein